jgi:probable HAF family extracellular repeat protein
MKTRSCSSTLVTTLFAVAITAPGLAQEQSQAAGSVTGKVTAKKHHHYKLVDMGTFGGPSSDTEDSLKVLNHRGMVAGRADTSTLDPNYPNSCLFCGPYIDHAFIWQDGNLVDLGALPGPNSSGAHWMSESGLTAGFSELSDQIDPLLNRPEMHAVLWKNGQVIDLGTLEGGYESVAFSVNSHGQVAGISQTLVPDPFNFLGTQQRTFLWERGVMQDIGTLGGPDAGLVGSEGNVEMNEKGQIVACSYINYTPNPATGIPTFDPFLWDKKKGMRDLGGLGGTMGCAIDINNHGDVVGYSNLPGDTASHPFVWVAPGPMQDLGTLGGNVGFSIWANESGEVVGSATNGDQAFHGFVWKKGTMIDLGTLDPLPFSFAEWINASKQIVGKATSSDFSTQIAVLWENGGPPEDLNTLVSPGSNLVLNEARNINDRGEISGGATDTEGNNRAFLLIPCDENHPDIKDCDYSLVDAAPAARRPAEANQGRQVPKAFLQKLGTRRFGIRRPATGA